MWNLYKWDPYVKYLTWTAKDVVENTTIFLERELTVDVCAFFIHKIICSCNFLFISARSLTHNVTENRNKSILVYVGTRIAVCPAPDKAKLRVNPIKLKTSFVALHNKKALLSLHPRESSRPNLLVSQTIFLHLLRNRHRKIQPLRLRNSVQCV